MHADTTAELTALIRAESARLGFWKVGIAPAGLVPRSRPFARWLDGGLHGSMRYMERQAARRRDPSLVLPDARSILVLAMNYYSSGTVVEDPSRGIISRYAWGEDYHQVLGERLRSLCAFIQGRVPEARALWYVDTGPVMEKVWGAESGLGWMGKHSNLLTRAQGSWFFIGVVLLNLELDYGPPAKDYCGICTRCIAACPTGAIVAPYVVDARLCISYLTIELRGSIPRGLRPLIGNRIFGCDDCQEACPWNRFAVDTPVDAFRPRLQHRHPELSSLVSITPEEFRVRFSGSAVRRAGRDGLARNVAIALGNSRRPESVAPLAAAMKDPSPTVRGHAAWALGRIATAEAACVLREARMGETEPSVLEEVVLAEEELSR